MISLANAVPDEGTGVISLSKTAAPATKMCTGKKTTTGERPFGAARFSIGLLSSLIALSSCAGSNHQALPNTFEYRAGFATHGGALNPIRHIVILVQSGRSFDDIFAGWPGANTSLVGLEHTGLRVRLHNDSYAQSKAMDDSFGTAYAAYDYGKMNGFDLNSFARGGLVGSYPFASLDHNEAIPYRFIASHYVLADRMYETERGPQFTALQHLIAGTTFVTQKLEMENDPNSRVWGCDAPSGTRVRLVVADTLQVLPLKRGVFPCLSQYATIADTLDAAGVSWKYYVSPITGDDPSGWRWSAFDAIKKVRYGSDWAAKVESPPTRVLQDVASGNLPEVSWVIPKLAWSDDPSQTSDEGPSWVATVINAIGKSSSWKSSVVIVVWNDWGGWYDNSTPPVLYSLLGLTGLSFRVPCLIVSPFAKAGYVSNTLYDFGSILKFVEETYNLPSLSATGRGFRYTDAPANSMFDSLALEQRPRAFEPIPAKYPPSFFIR